MAPTTTIKSSMRSQLPKDVKTSSIITILHNHEVHIGLMENILKRTQLGSQTVALSSEIIRPESVEEWLISETVKLVDELKKGNVAGPKGEQSWEVEFWELEIPHPLGKMGSSNLK